MNRSPHQLPRLFLAALALAATALARPASAELIPVKGATDARIRSAPYSSDEVYRLYGIVGFQIDLEFAPGESFVGLGAGDIEGLSFVAQGSHLFLKPKAAKIGTNLTILTDRRQYQIAYTASAHAPAAAAAGAAADPIIFSLRFTYPPDPASADEDAISATLNTAAPSRPVNRHYLYCGPPSIQPVEAFDDGVHTYLRFAPNAELPALFVRNADATESLLNFNVRAGQIIIHRIAPEFVLRRGKLIGCVRNAGFAGSGERLETGTLSPNIERLVPGANP